MIRTAGYLKSEQPNNSLYTYEGTLYLSTQSGQKQIPLDPTQILLRVCAEEASYRKNFERCERNAQHHFYVI